MWLLLFSRQKDIYLFCGENKKREIFRVQAGSAWRLMVKLGGPSQPTDGESHPQRRSNINPRTRHHQPRVPIFEK